MKPSSFAQWSLKQQANIPYLLDKRTFKKKIISNKSLNIFPETLSILAGPKHMRNGFSRTFTERGVHFNITFKVFVKKKAWQDKLMDYFI